MGFSPEFKRFFAVAILALAFVHFVLETVYSVIVGLHFFEIFARLHRRYIANCWRMFAYEKYTQHRCIMRIGALRSVFIIARGRGGLKI